MEKQKLRDQSNEACKRNTLCEGEAVDGIVAILSGFTQEKRDRILKYAKVILSEPGTPDPLESWAPHKGALPPKVPKFLT